MALDSVFKLDWIALPYSINACSGPKQRFATTDLSQEQTCGDQVGHREPTIAQP